MEEEREEQAVNGPIMLDLTTLVKKPPFRWAIAGALLFEFRQVLAALIGAIVSLPIVMALWGFGLQRMALSLFLGFSVAGALLAVSRPEGQSPVGYILSVMKQKLQTTKIDDQKVKLYVGLSPVTDFHGGQKFRYAKSAFHIKPDMVDERGALQEEVRVKP